MTTLKPIKKLIRKGVNAIRREYNRQLRAIDMTRDQKLKRAKSRAEREIIIANANYAKAALEEKVWRARAAAKKQRDKATAARHAAGHYTLDEKLSIAAARLGREISDVVARPAKKRRAVRRRVG